MPSRCPARSSPASARTAGATGASPTPGTAGSTTRSSSRCSGSRPSLLSQLTNPFVFARIRDAELKFGAHAGADDPGADGGADPLDLERGLDRRRAPHPGATPRPPARYLDRMTTILVTPPSRMPADARAVARMRLEDLDRRIAARDRRRRRSTTTPARTCSRAARASRRRSRPGSRRRSGEAAESREATQSADAERGADARRGVDAVPHPRRRRRCRRAARCARNDGRPEISGRPVLPVRVATNARRVPAAGPACRAPDETASAPETFRDRCIFPMRPHGRMLAMDRSGWSCRGNESSSTERCSRGATSTSS